MRKIVMIMVAAAMALPAMGTQTDVPASAPQKKEKKAKKVKEIKEVVFPVYLDCESCANKIVENISFERGVTDLDVSLEKQHVAVKYDASKTTEEKLKKALEDLGYPVLKQPVEHNHHHHHNHEGHNHSH